MLILGIDPGTTRIGYGLIESKGGDIKALNYGLLEIKSGQNIEKLLELGRRFESLLNKLKPDAVAIEEVYFSNNQKTAIAVAEARGVLRFISAKNNIRVFEYGPQQVKLALTGDGRADKIGVKTMVCRTLGFKAIKGVDDITDALAISITCAARIKYDGLEL
jgi:crossover junction endodeoxyribonuclease RuvC